MEDSRNGNRFTLIVALLIVYIVWGSTYLAIRYAIETIPPWTSSALRFAIAGFLMALIAFARGERSLQAREVKISAISGAFLICANGIVCVVEKWLPSGFVAVIIGAMPLWIMLLAWAFFGAARPALDKLAGALIGVAGIALIVSDGHLSLSSGGRAEVGLGLLALSSFLWAFGTLLQRKVAGIRNQILFIAVQMLSGAVAVSLISAVAERPWEMDWSTVSTRSWLALAYLLVFGAMVAYSAYSWLARHAEPHVTSTYALVNPVIAVSLGSLFLSETLTLKFVGGTALVLGGLFIILLRRKVKSLQAGAVSSPNP